MRIYSQDLDHLLRLLSLEWQMTCSYHPIVVVSLLIQLDLSATFNTIDHNILLNIFFFLLLRWALFVTYTIIQSITSSEMCSLHLTLPSAHTWSSGKPALRRPGSSWGFSALLKDLTSVVDNSSRSRDSNPQPRVTSPTLYPLGNDCPK